MSISKKIQKIPCGGFELGDGLEVKDGKLGLAEGGGGNCVVTLTKDETEMPFTSAKRLYTADKTIDEINEAINSGKNIILFAPYINSHGTELYGNYHLAGYYNNGEVSFINVEASVETILARGKAIVGYDTIVLNEKGIWIGCYTYLLESGS